jgi:hypothetical protein
MEIILNDNKSTSDKWKVIFKHNKNSAYYFETLFDAKSFIRKNKKNLQDAIKYSLI